MAFNPPGHTLNWRGAGSLVHRSRFSACLGYGSWYPGTRSRLAGCRPVVCGCMASGSAAGGRRQMEIVYEPDVRINRLADEVDKEAGLSSLALFSPCKIIRALNLYRQKTGSDNYF